MLDRDHRSYDITTDIELANARVSAGAFPAIARRSVLFAASPRLFSPEVARAVRAHLRAGGRVAWLGTDGFTQPVSVRGETLRRLPTLSSGRNAMGERLRLDVRNAALTVLSDQIDFFAGGSDVFGPFPTLEPSERLPAGAELLAAAGHEAGSPSLVVYRQGKGVVVRVGVDGFARTALQSPDVARIMRRLWTLLSR
jgi:hypothetical protein